MNEEVFNRDTWVQEHPIDYMHVISSLYQSNDYQTMGEVFKVLYGVLKLYIPDVLYKYYSLNDDISLNQSKFNTLDNNEIYLASREQLNDPHDGKGIYYRTDILSKYDRFKPFGGRIIEDFSQYATIASFTANGIFSMPMWGNYANNHKGYCVSYDMRDPRNKDLLVSTFPVQYVEKKIDITPLINSFASDMIHLLNEAEIYGAKEVKINDWRFVTALVLLENIKHISWSYENEYRYANTKKEKNSKAFPKEIYVGRDCVKENEQILKDIAKHNNVPIYKMENDDDSIEFWMKANRLD